MLEYSKEPNKKRPAFSKPDKRSLSNHDDLIDLFPLPRYFQIHFAHLHEANQALQNQIHTLDSGLLNQLDNIKQTLTAVEEKMDRFIALLNQHIEP